uniref:Uncharacterized protein n=1 Tax=Acrobeloides nanus TaxID=290746 RepID=A0A914CP78_9BILA
MELDIQDAETNHQLFAYVVQNPTAVHIPLKKVEKFAIRSYEVICGKVSMKTDEMINFIFDQQSHRNREALKIRLEDNEMVDFMEKYIGELKRCKFPEKAIKQLCIRLENPKIEEMPFDDISIYPK